MRRVCLWCGGGLEGRRDLKLGSCGFCRAEGADDEQVAAEEAAMDRADEEEAQRSLGLLSREGVCRSCGSAGPAFIVRGGVRMCAECWKDQGRGDDQPSERDEPPRRG